MPTAARTTIGSISFWLIKLGDQPNAVLDDPEVRETLGKLERQFQDLDSVAEEVAKVINTPRTIVDAQLEAGGESSIDYSNGDVEVVGLDFWRQRGAEAHAAGKVAAPALDEVVLWALKSIEVGHPGTKPLLTAWTEGYVEAVIQRQQLS